MPADIVQITLKVACRDADRAAVATALRVTLESLRHILSRADLEFEWHDPYLPATPRRDAS